jgi:hypothetical protein
MLQITAHQDMPLDVVMTDDIFSGDTTVGGAALGAGDVEEAGLLSDEVEIGGEIGAGAFADGLNFIEAPVALDFDIYHDGCNIFGALSSLNLS